MSAAAAGAFAFGVFAALLAAVAFSVPRRGRIARLPALPAPSAPPRLLLERPG
jgi:hypothetical protein